jgi:oligoribonuclease NrnB/cAMP/cGMP phosphodiesterase (DHH superfamily)
MKRAIFSHTDLDGIGSIILTEYFEIKFDLVYFSDYKDNEDPEYLKIYDDYDEIVIADFSLPKEKIEELLQKGKIIYLFDHHDSSESLKEIIHPNFKIFHSKEFCGTKLFFENYIKPQFKRMKPIVEEFVTLVNTYDLFKSDDLLWIEAQKLNRVMYSTLDYGQDQWNLYGRFINSIVNKLKTESKWNWNIIETEKINKDILKENKMYEASKRILQTRTDSKGNKFGLFHNRGKLSIICQRLLKEFYGLKYIIAINTYDGVDGVGWQKLSIRSRDENEFNCTHLRDCKGHTQAAGSSCTVEFGKDLWMGKVNALEFNEENK